MDTWTRVMITHTKIRRKIVKLLDIKREFGISGQFSCRVVWSYVHHNQPSVAPENQRFDDCDVCSDASWNQNLVNYLRLGWIRLHFVQQSLHLVHSLFARYNRCRGSSSWKREQAFDCFTMWTHDAWVHMNSLCVDEGTVRNSCSEQLSMA